jgi:adenosylmethionine-8-amino-7-oxononanoate aminotransferase
VHAEMPEQALRCHQSSRKSCIEVWEPLGRTTDWLARSQAAVWHPCTQMQHHAQTGSPAHLPLVPIARGRAPGSTTFDGKRYLDGISSWWTNLFGHANPRINAALKDQLETLEHVMLAGFTHQPVVELSERLSALTGGALGHAFYASDGASATEIALKMSFHYWRNVGRPEKANSSAWPAATTAKRSARWPSPTSPFSRTPTRRWCAPRRSSPRPISGWPKPAKPRPMSPAAPPPRWKPISNNMANIAALIVEPLVQGAAGMAMYDPEYLRLARALCDRYEVHLICDEIAVGCGRTGTFFAHEQATAPQSAPT